MASTVFTDIDWDKDGKQIGGRYSNPVCLNLRFHTPRVHID